MDTITMIGFSGSGKTCFLYAMYNNMLTGHSGISFVSTEHDTNLDLTEGWDDIVLRKNWPQGTNQTRFYDFSIMHHLRPYASFKWCDYRGGILRDREVNNPEAQEFHQRILESDSLILCIGAETILDLHYQRENASVYEFQSFNFLIANYARTQSKRIPISIVLTKSDLYSPEENKIAFKIVKRELAPLFQVGGDWEVSIIFASLGSKLAHDQTNQIIGTIAPYNVHLPVLFSMITLVGKKIKEIVTRQNEYDYDMQRWNKSELNWVQRMVQFFISLFISQDYVDQSEGEKYTRLADEQQLSELRRCSSNMKKQVAGGAIVYYNGVELKR